MSNVVVYSRVSTREQATEGLSLDMQEERCRQYAALHDLTVVGVVRDEGVSAKDLHRPGIRTLRSMMTMGTIEGIVVYRLDRLTRSVRDFASLNPELEDAGVRLYGVTDSLDTASASGRLAVHILLSVAQWEREMTAERIADTFASVKAKGYHMGQAPWGWERLAHAGPGSLLVTTDKAQETMEQARKLFAADLSLRMIGKAIGYDHPEKVKRILRAPLRSEMVAEGKGYRHPH